ncbi:beta-galactosidase BglB [Vallitalea guaymasensis]|uniref:beta-galactosidase BglB n=1 Tax=Vallitalea guaymasensis TaxID=1185412 RepID=UPI002353803B|nr:glycoside hydrolase family 88 protein [Vallitalea guaymasensis]
MKKLIMDKMEHLASAFRKVLYTEDEQFMENMKNNNLADDNPMRYRFWEWTQGVGLYGIWKMYKLTGDKKYKDELINYYNERIKEGLPSKNINTVAPLLALAFLNEEVNNKEYTDICNEWVEWIMNELPRTKEGGFQHITSDTVNENELWDDTLFMTVLFLAKMSQINNNKRYLEEAKYQFLIHIKYLFDKETGLWYHGWTFNGNNNFAKGLWGRGNCWITLAIPEFIRIVPLEDSFKRYLSEVLINQVKSLKEKQNTSGMWHTLLDDPTSYDEASATCGFGAGILSGIEIGIIDESYAEIAFNAVKPILKLIDDEGVLNQVSYGTPMGRQDLQFYKDIPLQPMPYGQALGILFLGDVLKYEFNK